MTALQTENNAAEREHLAARLRKLADSIESGKGAGAEAVLEMIAAFLTPRRAALGDVGDVSRLCPECDGRGGIWTWEPEATSSDASRRVPLRWNACTLCDGEGSISSQR